MAENGKPDKIKMDVRPQDIFSALIQNDLRFEITIAAITKALVDKNVLTEEELQEATNTVIADTKKKAAAIVTPSKSGIILPGNSSQKH